MFRKNLFGLQNVGLVYSIAMVNATTASSVSENFSPRRNKSQPLGAKSELYGG